MSPLWNSYKHPFHKNHVCPQGITYNATPGLYIDTGPGPGGVCRHQSVCYLIFFNYFQQNDNLKKKLDTFGEKGAWEG